MASYTDTPASVDSIGKQARFRTSARPKRAEFEFESVAPPVSMCSLQLTLRKASTVEQATFAEQLRRYAEAVESTIAAM